ncbi:MAG: DNA-packaging protein [Hyphomicrobiales bacterium]|nr:DNA-packaging protein [Hyphomicrobiales bacterium]
MSDATTGQTLPRSISPNCDANLRDGLIYCARIGEIPELFASYSARELEAVLSFFEFRARKSQTPPMATPDGAPWRAWLFVGGRGAGKTRAGAEWVRGMAGGFVDFADRPARRIALIGETWADARDVMVEGVSGILAAHQKWDRPQWEASRRRLTWRNGAIAQVFSAEDPESLRGPQFDAAWCDEVAKWRHVQEVWDMLQFGLRLGEWPRAMVTTTPRPLALLKKLMADPANVVTRASTRANAENLAPAFLRAIEETYGGTRLGRQEIDGAIVEERADALWSGDMLEQARIAVAPPLARIVVAVDPPAASHKRADKCGIVAAGVDGDGLVYVLSDVTLAAAKPAEWAARATALYQELQADALVVEVNQGGDMVASVIAQADPSVPVVKVRATRGKYLRAAPVALLYEQNRVRHAGAFPELEDEMCAFGPDGLMNGASPDRLDALVWAITHLALDGKRATPRVRRL